MKQSDIIAANRATADQQDWTKENLRIELRAQEMLKPRSHSSFSRDQTFKENTAEQLGDIQKENVKQPGRG